MIIDKIIRDKVTVLLEQASYNIILPFYKNLREDEIETKTTSDDFVTTADRQVEIFLTNALIKLIKHSSVIGEEASLLDSDYSSILKNEFVYGKTDDKLLEKQKLENIDLSERLKKLGRPEGKVLGINQKKIAVTPWFSVTVNENKLKKLNNSEIDTLIEAVTNYLKSNVKK